MEQPRPPQHPIRDHLQRALGNLRLSVTDRCNLRCQYCMPEEDYLWLSRGDLLTFEELSRMVDVFTDLGVERFRLTGGEPLLRRDLPLLIQMLSRKHRVRDLAITTNGVLLAELAPALRAAGLHRVTVSLDTLRADRFLALVRRDAIERVLAGIAATQSAGFENTKIDTVVMRGVNDDEMIDLLEYGKTVGAEVRFIEYMDVGGATQWSADKVVTQAEILTRLGRHYGPLEPVVETTTAPAERFRLQDGTTLGIIASTTSPFCWSCDRSRLTADGMWYLCLYARSGIDLRTPLRAGASAADLASIIADAWGRRQERGAEQRLAAAERGVLHETAALREDPHLEMHTRGG